MNHQLTTATRRGLVIVAAMLALTAWAWGQIPAGAEIPTHWNFAGDVDGTSGKAFGLFSMPVVNLLLIGVLWLVPMLEPRREHLVRSSLAFTTIMVSVFALMALVHALLIFAALGTSVDMERLIPAAIGALFIVIGSVMHRMESTFMMGIRTPWTLSSERSWKATHQAGRWVFIAFGAILLISAAVGGGEALSIWMFGGLMVAIAGLVAYSYVVWREDGEREMR